MDLFEKTEDVARRLVDAGVEGMRRLARRLEDPGEPETTHRVPLRLAIDLRTTNRKLLGPPRFQRRGKVVSRAKARRVRRPALISPPRPRIGERLLARGLVHTFHVEEALLRQATFPRRLGEILIGMEVVSEEDVSRCLAEMHSVDFIDLEKYLIDAATAKLVPEHIAQRHQLIPVSKVAVKLTVAMIDPLNVLAVDEVELMTGLRVEVVCATPGAMRKALMETYGAQSQMSSMFEDIDTQYGDRGMPDDEGFDLDPDAGPIVKLVNLLIANAVISRVDEILLEPFERELRVRYRRHGDFWTEMTPPKKAQEALLRRVRVMSGAVTYRERHGQILTRVANRRVDLRVTYFQTAFGDGAKLEIQQPSPETGSLESMGLMRRDIDQLRMLLRIPPATVVLVGPCPFTVDRARNHLVATVASVASHVVTVGTSPRPQVPGVHHRWARDEDQLADFVDEAISLDPDILVVDRPQDPSLLTRLLELSLAGTLVIVTLPATDLLEGIEQLQGCGLSPRRLARALETMIACHPVPAACRPCSTSGVLSPFLLETLGEDLSAVQRMGFTEGPHGGFAAVSAPGCAECRDRIPTSGDVAYQVLPVKGSVAEALREGLAPEVVDERARHAGMPDPGQAALAAVLLGRSSVEGWRAIVERRRGGA